MTSPQPLASSRSSTRKQSPHGTQIIGQLLRPRGGAEQAPPGVGQVLCGLGIATGRARPARKPQNQMAALSLQHRPQDLIVAELQQPLRRAQGLRRRVEAVKLG